MTWPQHMRPITRLAIAALYAAWLGACGYDVGVNAPSSADSSARGKPDSTRDSTGGGAFQRATLTVDTRLTGSDSVVAAEIGMRRGVLQGGVVTIQRQGSATSLTSDSTDLNGRAVFTRLVPGTYDVSANRLLTLNESAQLDSANRDVNGFGGGISMPVRAPAESTTVIVVAGRRGSLIFSEIFDSAPLINGFSIGNYVLDQFVEVYNNSDTTIYLDGKIIGRSIYQYREDAASGYTCAAMDQWRNDPNGIWTSYFDAFPGSGHDHPLLPGKTAVIATDATDHSTIRADLPNLTAADFEYHGSNDVDNPLVPNMVNIGLYEWAPPPTFPGHGEYFLYEYVTFLADSVTVSSLPRAVVFPTRVYGTAVEMPAAKILDVYSTSEAPGGDAVLIADGFTLCPQMVNARFDRQHANLSDPYKVQSTSRRVFTTLPDGRVILLRTKSSANDFEVALPTPGTVGK